jgi:hypothetical protein
MRAALRRENGSKDANTSYAEWEQVLKEAVRAGDRQQEDFAMTPINSVMGGPTDGWGLGFQNIGAANPYGSSLYGVGYGLG